MSITPSHLPKHHADHILFTPEQIKEGQTATTRLIREFFADERITNGQYMTRYLASSKAMYPDHEHRHHVQSAAADRKFLLDPRRVTPKMTLRVIERMGFTVVDHLLTDDQAAIRVTNNATGEVSLFFTSMQD